MVSTDEKTGIQALERLYPTRPMKPGEHRPPVPVTDKSTGISRSLAPPGNAIFT
ncbi:MAG: hypothetical protein GDA48_03500 [Hormoscilla sp. GM102CHS1]|nr:hypothetical protein [Hormoscilla sp. GM102CHS1]